MTRPDRSLAVFAAIGVVGVVVMGGRSGMTAVALVTVALFAAALHAWRRSPDASNAGWALMAAGFVRLVLGPIGVGALLMVPVLAARVAPDEGRPLVGAAIGVHLAVFAAHQLALALGEPFPSLAACSPGEALVGVALFGPFLLARRDP
jgi:hypothetical protein